MKFVQGSVPLVLVAIVLLYLSVLPTNSQQPSGCLLPSTDQINSRLRSILLSQGGEGSRTNTTLASHHFSCLAVADTNDRFVSLSLAVTYTTATTGDQLLRYQFELECSNGVYQASRTNPDSNPPNEAFTESRRDCQVCSGATGPANLIDTVTNCIFCSPTCSALGQGSCANGEGNMCCPFFTADGACTMSCPTNFVATRATNYTCTCNFSCPLGFEVNSTCSGCDTVHICLTNNPCLNQGTCVIGSNNSTDYTCNCPDGFTGRNCETATLGNGNCTVNGESIAVGESRVFLELNRNRLYGEFVLLLDESSSMSREHNLIRQLLRGLDTSLRNLSIGNTVRNRYGLLGFSSSNNNPPFGVVYTTTSGEQFVNIEDISELINQISTGDRYEDGYAAIGLAFDQYRFGGGARQFLLVTDEDRDNLNTSLTRQVIMDKLRDTQTRLNVLVSEEFQAGDTISLGMNQDNDTFVFNPLAPAQFVRKRNGKTVVDSGHGTTHVDYTELVLQTDGAVWDINTITGSPGQLNIGFINALARQKGVEIVEQLGRCLNCTCRPDDLSCVEVSSEVNTQCNISEVIRSVIPPDMSGDLGANLMVSLNVSYGFVLNGSRVTLECTAQSSETVNFAWTFKGRTLPNNAEVTSSSIRSFLTITDFTKDNTGKYTCFTMSGSGSTRSAGDRTSYLEVDFPPEVVPTPSTVPRIQSTSSFRSSTIVVGPTIDDPPIPPPVPVIELLSNRIETGTDVRLICTTSNLAMISWRYAFGDLPANAVVTKINNQRSELNITNFNVLNNTGSYSCIAQVGDITNTTSVVLVPTVGLSVPNIAPSPIELNEGDHINVTCTSNIPADHTWQYRMNQLPNGVSVVSISPTESRLIVRNFQANIQEGEYRCVVSLAESSRSRVVFISLRDIFRISATPMLVNRTIAEISEQNPVRFMCRLECSCNGGTVMWVRRGSAMAGPVGRTSTLTITRPEFEVNGEHQCVGIPPPSSGSQRVLLSVSLIISDLIRPVSVMVNHATQTVSIGGSATVVCQSNRPVLRFEWAYLRDDGIDLPDNADFRTIMPTVSQLTVSNANNGNTGVYFCRGIFSDTDEVAIQRTQIFLPDSFRVEITRSSTSEGQLTLRCSLGCTCSGAVVSWSRVGGDSLPSTVSVFTVRTRRVSTLTIASIDSSNVGAYRCTATLNDDTASDTTTVSS